MVGFIKSEDIQKLKETCDIVDVITPYVTLKPAGIAAFKGLCPFHNEKTASFSVNQSNGFYHCFGCGESGNVITFLEKIHSIDFVEAVELLASLVGMSLTYENNHNFPANRAKNPEITRSRLIAANQAAHNYFRNELKKPTAKVALDFLTRRGFTTENIEQFELGFAQDSWGNLRDYLTSRGFLLQELFEAGLVKQGQTSSTGLTNTNNYYDVFRGRLLWPIKDNTGQVVGFGGRKLDGSEKEFGDKYINTKETKIYKKTKVLYGIEKARQSIRELKSVVIVEGYSDVMAMHLSGIPNVVAPCGTQSFSTDHALMLTRLMGDLNSGNDLAKTSGIGKIVFVFDGDEAGQKAALKAFNTRDIFLGQLFVVVIPDNMDPLDYKLKHGASALRELVVKAKPLIEFVLSRTISNYDLSIIEGRSFALRAVAPVLKTISDPLVLAHYVGVIATKLGFNITQINLAVRQAKITDFGLSSPNPNTACSINPDQLGPLSRKITSSSQTRPAMNSNYNMQVGSSEQESITSTTSTNTSTAPISANQNHSNSPGQPKHINDMNNQPPFKPSDQYQAIQFKILALALQCPKAFNPEHWNKIHPNFWSVPLFRKFFLQIGQLLTKKDTKIAAQLKTANTENESLIDQLLFYSFPIKSPEKLPIYADDLLAKLTVYACDSKISEIKQRLALFDSSDSSSQEYKTLANKIIAYTRMRNKFK